MGTIPRTLTTTTRRWMIRRRATGTLRSEGIEHARSVFGFLRINGWGRACPPCPPCSVTACARDRRAALLVSAGKFIAVGSWRPNSGQKSDGRGLQAHASIWYYRKSRLGLESGLHLAQPLCNGAY